jgi:hypothetical protein
VADAVVDEIRAAGGEAVASHDSVDSPEAGAAIVGLAMGSYHGYSAGGGRFAPAFVGLTEGWYEERSEASAAEDIRDHLAQIDDEAGYTTPTAIRDETVGLMRCLGLRWPGGSVGPGVRS